MLTSPMLTSILCEVLEPHYPKAGSRVLKRLAYTGLGKVERDVMFAYLRRTSGYSCSRITRLEECWESNRLAPVPLAKRDCRPAGGLC